NARQHVDIFDLDRGKPDVALVVQDDPFRYFRHLESRRIYPSDEVTADEPLEVGVNHDLAPEGGGDALHGKVIVSGADPAGSNNDVKVSRAVGDFLGDPGNIIRNHGHALERDPKLAQLARGEVRIGVLDLAGQDLVSNHDQRTGTVSHRFGH